MYSFIHDLKNLKKVMVNTQLWTGNCNGDDDDDLHKQMEMTKILLHTCCGDDYDDGDGDRECVDQ